MLLDVRFLHFYVERECDGERERNDAHTESDCSVASFNLNYIINEDWNIIS
jgi:hypothetical protein